MKKAVTAVLGLLGILAVCVGIDMKQKSAVAVSIIGGADGPTSIFLAGKVGNDFSMAGIVIGILLIITAAILIARSRKK